MFVFSDYIAFGAVALLCAYGVYCIYEGIKRVKTFKEAEVQYLSTRKEGEYTYCKNYMIWLFLLLLGMILAVYFAYDFVKKNDYMYCLAYVFIAMLCLSLLLENYVARQAYFDHKGMFFVNNYYEFKMVQDVSKRKGLSKIYDVKVIGHDKFRLDGKLALELNTRLDVFKEEKKNKKK